MPELPDDLNLSEAEDLADIEPAPTLAVGEDDHHIESLGPRGSRLLRELLDDLDEDEPVSEGVFDELDEAFSHAEWEDYDLYWADDEEAFIDALEDWDADTV